jgi:MscS family membrane protein
MALEFKQTVAVTGLFVWLALFGSADSSLAQTRDAAPINRSSPEAVLKQLVENISLIEKNFETVEALRKKSSDFSYPQPTDIERRRVERAKKLVLDSLDLSAVPEWSRETVGIETALMLSELLRRAAAQAPLDIMEHSSASWTVKGTYIQLIKMSAGMRIGDVIVSAASVADIPSQYAESIAEIPIQGFDAYRYFTETPGGIFPPKWAGVVLSLPEFWRQSFASNTVWQWAAFTLTLLMALVLPLCAFLLPLGMTGRTLVASMLGTFVSWFGQEFAIKEASFTGSFGVLGSSAFSIIYFCALAALAFLIVEFVSDGLIRLLGRKKDGTASGFAKLLFRIVGVAASAGVVLYGLSTAGIPVVGIVAGLGVGGLAVALAAKTTLENLLACFVLYIDKSVQVGDIIETKELCGKIEHIGMRSIRVRSESGDLTTITNSKFADLTITKKGHAVHH